MFSFKLGRRKKKSEDDEPEEHAPLPAAGGSGPAVDLDEDGIPDFHLDEPPPPGPSLAERLRLGRLAAILGVLLLGGGLGTVGYFVANTGVGDVIGALDVADPANTTGPKLAMLMPGKGGEAAPPAVTAPPAETPALPPSAPAAEPPAAGGLGLLTPPVPPGVAPPVTALPGSPLAEPPLPPASLAQGQAPPPSPGALQPAAAPSPPVAVAAPLPQANLPRQPAPRDPTQPPAYASLPERADVKPLPAAPIPELVRQSALGAMPVIAPDGRQAWKSYAMPFSEPPEGPRIGVIVTDLGLDKEATEAAIRGLPSSVTLAFSPYAADLEAWVAKARKAGHEVMLMAPAESAGFPAQDPGPLALLGSLTPEDNLSRLEKVMGRATGYVGIAMLGTRLSGTPQLDAILTALKERGLMFAGEATAQGDRAPPAVAITAIIDQDLYREAIDSRLAQVADTARTDGRALAVASARPVTLDRLLVWLTKAQEQGLIPAPASALARTAGNPG